MEKQKHLNKFGWIWIIISPLLFLIAIISTVESELTYYVQLGFFSVISILGFISGVSLLFKKLWAQKVLSVLSWIGFIYFSGAGLLILIYSIPALIKSPDEALFMLPVALGVILTGLPFLHMAKKLKTDTDT